MASIVVTSSVVASDAIGDTLRFRAEARDNGGTVIPGVSVTWTSSEAGVATVAADGSVITRGNGSATISAAAGGVSGSLALTVQQRATVVRFSRDSVVLDRWLDTASVSVTATDRRGSSVPLSALQLTTTDSQVVRVTALGALTSGRDGTVSVVVAGAQADAARDTLRVRVAVQRNASCALPSAAPTRGAALGPVSWLSSAIPSSAVPMADTTMVGPIGAPAAMDVDGDGRTDAVVPWYIIDRPETRRTIAGLHVFRSSGGALVQATSTLWGSAPATWVFPRVPLVFDADGNGRTDLLLLDTGYDPAGYPGAGCSGTGGTCPGARNTLLLTTSGRLTDATARLTTNSSSGFSHSGDAADIDCDGDVDVLEGTWSSGDAPEPSHLHVNTGGTFTIDDARLPPTPSRSSGWVGAELCDLDRDGDPDAVVSTYHQRVRILVNNGFGSFRTMLTSAVPEAPGGDAATEYAEIRCTDVDGDGWNDIVLARHEKVVAGTALTLLRNNRDMSFRDATADAANTIASEGANAWVWNMTVANINADAWPDIVLLSPLARPRILYGAGDGRFNEFLFPASDWWIGVGNKVAVGDFNGDGRSDLYVFRGRFEHFLMLGQ